MKNFFNSLKQYSVGIIVGSIIGISIAVYANSISSSSVTYSHSLTSQTTVKGTLDEIINLTHTCKTTCPEGYTCKPKICKRVGHSSELHTETCNQTSYNCAATRGLGHTITYGNVGTKGTLAVGDAFDCDVMGDGTYEVDGEPARFYYVSTMAGHTTTTDSNYAVLVYYTNTDSGHNSTIGREWASSGSNSSGPVTAKGHLPGVGRSWPGVSLKNSTRIIADENGGSVTNFNYGRAQARLLTYQEVYNGCYNGSTAITLPNGLYSKCEFLFENTKYTDNSRATYGPWLETPNSSYPEFAWQVYSVSRLVDYSLVNDTINGVRPAIEVPLDDIAY